ncbi:MAG: cell division protein FtsQ/DivIB, partial [Marinirhabdus sp.]
MKTMQRMWDALKFLAIGTGAVLLFNFTNTRNLKRDITLGKITFVDDNEPFITENTVNKLLIQSKGGTAGIAKETLVLKEMESRLRKNQMVRDAQVYLHVNGTLGAKITQRNPVARVAAVPGFYLDADGKKMPLSTVYTARVPIVTASPGVQFKPLAPLLLAIE